MVKRKEDSPDRAFVFEDMGTARQANIDGCSEPDAASMAKHVPEEQQIQRDLQQGKPPSGTNQP